MKDDQLRVEEAAAALGVPWETLEQAREMMGQLPLCKELVGEKRLVLAMIEQSLAEATAVRGPKAKLSKYAQDWIATPDDDPIFDQAFSFDWCCEQVRIDPQPLRDLVFTSLAARTPLRRTRVAGDGDAHSVPRRRLSESDGRRRRRPVIVSVSERNE